RGASAAQAAGPVGRGRPPLPAPRGGRPALDDPRPPRRPRAADAWPPGAGGSRRAGCTHGTPGLRPATGRDAARHAGDRPPRGDRDRDAPRLAGGRGHGIDPPARTSGPGRELAAAAPSTDLASRGWIAYNSAVRGNQVDTREWEITQPASGREQRRAQAVAAIPSWYSPWGHLAFPSFVGLGMIACSIAFL